MPDALVFDEDLKGFEMGRDVMVVSDSWSSKPGNWLSLIIIAARFEIKPFRLHVGIRSQGPSPIMAIMGHGTDSCSGRARTNYGSSKCFCSKCSRKQGQRSVEKWKALEKPDYSVLLKPSFWVEDLFYSSVPNKVKQTSVPVAGS